MTQKMTVWRRLLRPQGNRTCSNLLFLYFSLFWCELLCLEPSHRGGPSNYRAAQRATKQQTKTALFCGENNGGVVWPKDCRLDVQYLCSVHSCGLLHRHLGDRPQEAAPAAAVSQGDSSASDGNTRRQLTLLEQFQCVLPFAQPSPLRAVWLRFVFYWTSNWLLQENNKASIVPVAP